MQLDPVGCDAVLTVQESKNPTPVTVTGKLTCWMAARFGSAGTLRSRGRSLWRHCGRSFGIWRFDQAAPVRAETWMVRSASKACAILPRTGNVGTVDDASYCGDAERQAPSMQAPRRRNRRKRKLRNLRDSEAYAKRSLKKWSARTVWKAVL
jgi:hypothetical protein